MTLWMNTIKRCRCARVCVTYSLIMELIIDFSYFLCSEIIEIGGSSWYQSILPVHTRIFRLGTWWHVLSIANLILCNAEIWNQLLFFPWIQLFSEETSSVEQGERSLRHFREIYLLDLSLSQNLFAVAVLHVARLALNLQEALYFI